jgi:DNA recombination protein RmuC
MNQVLFIIGGLPVTFVMAAGLGLAAIFAMLILMAVLTTRANRQTQDNSQAAIDRQRDMDEKMAALMRANSELTGRVQTMAEVLSTRQQELAKHVGERLDSVSHRMGQNLESSTKTTGDNLTKLNERLAVIDSAQARLMGLTQEVVSLKDILANKQTRGAFGQGRMESIVRDGLPQGAYDFQVTLSSGTRPDCLIKLPNDPRGLVVDAKFPLEAFSALKAATTEEERRAANARVRSDINKHVKDIADKYFLPDETQDLAMMFVPSESIYADLNEYFDDVVQKAYKMRVIIVSPSLLMLAVQVMQSIVRDSQMREQAHIIQKEVRVLLEDTGRLRDRVVNLEKHFAQAQKDVSDITTSADKITKRSERISALEFDDPVATTAVLANYAAAQ